MARAAALVLIAAAALAAGCGGGSKSSTTGSTSTAQRLVRPTDPTQPPASVPQKATGPVDSSSARVIRAWSKTLRAGHVERAAQFFSLPSKFQNATPVLTIDSKLERIAINEALSCGAVPTKLGSAGDFTIVTFKLVQRKGADCGQGVGGTARTAIRVSQRQIHEWYRLPDSPGVGDDLNSGPTV